MDEAKDMEEEEIERLRARELESRRWMSSQPDRSHSFGQWNSIKKKVNEKYDDMIAKARKRRAAEPISPESERRHQKKRRRVKRDKERKTSSEVDSDRSEDSNSDDDSESTNNSSETSFSPTDDDADYNSVASEEQPTENSDESDHEYNRKTRSAKKNKSNNQRKDVIDIDDSDSDSESGSDWSMEGSIGGPVDGPEDGSVSGSIDVSLYASADSSGEGSLDDDPVDGPAKSDSSVLSNNDGDSASIGEGSTHEPGYQHDADNHRGEGLQSNHFASNKNNNASTNDDNYSSDDDEGDEDGEIERYHVSKIKQSRLTMVAQGFRCQASERHSPPTTEVTNTRGDCLNGNDYTPFDPSSVDYRGRTFHKNRCYVLKEGDVTVGIKRFLSTQNAMCILIERFDDTLLGTEDEGLEYKADYMIGTHVQVHKCIRSLSLDELDRESVNVTEIPCLIYEPQTPGDWYTFGYFYDRTNMRRRGKRQGGIRSLELFAGAGGSLLGYKNCGFETVMAVENDPDAVSTLKHNNAGLKVYDGCIRKFVKDYDVLKLALGRIDHIHFSSPCQDFSTANRSQATGRRDRADLSLLLVDLVRKTSCSTAVWENVVGLWRRKNVHYIKTITKELMKLGYQVRCTVLSACDYGDPQKRDRFFMFISKNNVPMAQFPSKTHGTGPNNLWPYVTVGDALSCVTDGQSLPNMEGRKTTIKPGQHGAIRLNGYHVAPTIRASAGTPFHPKENRCINVREAACLQSFPVEYKLFGGMSSQYRMVGNAVPVELSTAVAQSIRQILMYHYGEMKDE